ncbi:hypothetical protein ACHAXR_012924 [Thalassiosira sp. AJA248-18]
MIDIDNNGMPLDLSDDPSFENMNRAALLAWQERQRRQRTLRMLMMFLMVLLLMEGDEPPNSRRHPRNRQHLRRHDKNRGRWEKLGYLDDEGNLISPLNPEVYRSRVEEDTVILQALKENRNSRYHELVKKNDGRDVEEELREWVGEKLDEEVSKGMMMDDKNDDSGDDEGSEDGIAGGATDRKQTSRGVKKMKDDESKKKEQTTTSAVDEKMNELDDLTVFHYPRNATGYYRGLWVRTPRNKTSASNDKRGKKAKAKADNLGNNDKEIGDEADQADSAPPRNVTVEEIHTWAQTQLHQRNTDVGLLFLPPNVYFEPDKPKAKNSTSKHDNSKSRSAKDSKRSNSELGQTTSSSSKPSSSTPKPLGLSLTKEAGRAAFQLYSRPIPAMNEISIVDGLVKLYDGMTTSFVSRRTDVLLRVRGVMIHGAGKMSLVTSSTSEGVMKGRQRSFLGVREIQKDEKDTQIEDEEEINSSDDDDDHDDDDDDEEESTRRHRRLQTIVSQLLSESDEQPKMPSNLDGSNGIDTLMPHIRQEIMDLYEPLYIKDDIHVLENSKSMQKNGWTLLQSVDEGLFAGDDETFADDFVGERPVGRKLVKVDDEESPSDHSLPADLNTTTNNGTDLAWRRSILTLSATQQRSSPMQYAFPYPYALDDAEDSIKNAQSPATRRLPNREQALMANAADCEFEINIDVQSTKWTFGEWRSSMGHRMRIGGVFFNPHWNIAYRGSDVVKLEKSQYLLVMKSQLDFLEEQTPKEALVMTMIGDIESKNCDFHSFVNVTAMRTNWEHTTAKAINYSFYMMLTCLTQIVILLRQLLHTQAQSVATNVSLLCIGWQTVLDAIMCISHIFLCLVMQPLFTAFASVAFFKLLIFCVIEMKYMAIIIQARNNANNTGLTQEDLRRQITLLHLKFYGALMLAIIAFWYFGQSNRTLYVLLLYSFWVPQIILNIISESRKPMHPYYIYGMSISRSIAPIYVFAVRNNFLKEVNPDFPTEPKMCQLLILWIGFQTAILFAQSKYGTRFMIPQRFLPPKFDYSRPIPSSLLPRPVSNPPNASSPSEIELGPLLNSDASPSRERSNGVTRNRRGGGSRTRLDSRAEDVVRTTSMSEDRRDAPTLDCVICYNEIDVNDRQGYMLAPCDHIFHRHCLEQWMDVKMECPICRCNLPSL